MTLELVLTLAWRNLWRNYRRTLIMLLAIVVGVWAMIFMTAMMRGMVDDMIRSGIRHLPGHVQIHQPGFRDDPNIENSLTSPDADIREAFSSPLVKNWTQRLKLPSVISSEREVRGIQLLGVVPDSEAAMAFDVTQVSEGRWLKDSTDTGLVIGAKLAEKLETRLGKRVVIMSQDVNNEIGERGFRIVGIYHSDNVALEEELNVYAGLEIVQKMLKADNRVSELVFDGKDYRQPQALQRYLQNDVYHNDPGVEVLPWYDADVYLGTMMSVMDGFVLVWILVIFLALSFGLVNTLVMAVFERVREIGLMQALGMTSRLVMAQILVEAFFLLTLGLVLGNVLAFGTIIPLESGIDISAVAQGMEMFGANSVLYPSLQMRDVILADTVVIVLGVLASVLPAWRASHYDPIVALNKH